MCIYIIIHVYIYIYIIIRIYIYMYIYLFIRWFEYWFIYLFIDIIIYTIMYHVMYHHPFISFLKALLWCFETLRLKQFCSSPHCPVFVPSLGPSLCTPVQTKADTAGSAGSQRSSTWVFKWKSPSSRSSRIWVRLCQIINGKIWEGCQSWKSRMGMRVCVRCGMRTSSTATDAS